MSLFNSYDRTKFLGETNRPLNTGSGVVTPDQQKAAIRTNIGAASSGDVPGLATATVAGTVKQAANQAASTASDVAGAVADLNTLLAALKTAGIMVAD